MLFLTYNGLASAAVLVIPPGDDGILLDEAKQVNVDHKTGNSSMNIDSRKNLKYAKV